MATIVEIINAAYGVYMQSCEREELAKAVKDLAEMLADAREKKYINAENSENGEFLKIKLELKTLAVAYFCEGYEHFDFLALKDFAENAVKQCADLGFKKTGELCSHVLSHAAAVDAIMYDAVALKDRVCDADGRCVAKDAAECKAVSDALTAKTEAVDGLEFPTRLFTDGAYFPDVKGQLACDLNDLRAVCDAMAGEFSAGRVAEIMRTAVEDITERLDRKRIEYYPTLDIERLARAIVLFTPFNAEAEIAVWACADGKKIASVQALAFEGLETSCIDAVFDELVKGGYDCIIYGATHYRDGNEGEFFRSVLRFTRGGGRAYIVADDGTRAVYERALKAAVAPYSPLDISFLYLSMPDFVQTVDVMRGLGMLAGEGEDIDFVRKHMPFVGFDGFNEITRAFALGADWKSIAEQRSADNLTAATKYMLRLRGQALFLDGGWGNYHDDEIIHRGKSFDYDDIKLVNPDNIKKIMEGNFTLFQKCGMISAYCLLCGASAADWAELPVELKEERLAEASKLVMRALGLLTVPKVEVKENVGGKAGAVCYDGGKRIVYKHSCIKDFDWTAKTVCHECFHAFQNFAVNEGWRDWFETELHVTPGRIEQWRYNNGKYRHIDKDYTAYMIQIIESDARAFENDCLGRNESMGQILNLVDFD